MSMSSITNLVAVNLSVPQLHFFNVFSSACVQEHKVSLKSLHKNPFIVPFTTTITSLCNNVIEY